MTINVIFSPTDFFPTINQDPNNNTAMPTTNFFVICQHLHIELNVYSTSNIVVSKLYFILHKLQINQI